MPRLILLRHAKAEPAAKASARDFDRVLSDHGRRDAEEMGQVIAQRGERIDAVLSSSSKRTRQTWDGLREALNAPPEPKFLREIYDGQPSYLDIIRDQAGTASALLLIGHNPNIQETAILLAADLSGPEGAALNARFPTAALAILDFDRDWRDLAPGGARLEAFIRPRETERD